MQPKVADRLQEMPAGLSTPDALHQAYGRIYASLVGQAQTLAYVDTFWMLSIIALCLIPLLLFLRRSESGKTAMAHQSFSGAHPQVVPAIIY